MQAIGSFLLLYCLFTVTLDYSGCRFAIWSWIWHWGHEIGQVLYGIMFLAGVLLYLLGDDSADEAAD